MSSYVPYGFLAAGWKLAALPTLFACILLISAFKANKGYSQRVDRKMYKLWCLWIVAFFPLPLLNRGLT